MWRAGLALSAGSSFAYAGVTDRQKRASHMRLVRCVGVAASMLTDYSAVLRRKRRLIRMEEATGGGARRVDDAVLAWCAAAAARGGLGSGTEGEAFVACDVAASRARAGVVVCLGAAVAAAALRSGRGAAVASSAAVLCALLSEGIHLPTSAGGGGGLVLDEATRKALMIAAHDRNSYDLRALLYTNKGIYIKIGQHLGLLDYLIPKEYVEAMRGSFDDAPRSEYDDVVAVLEESLGCPISAMFESFDREPIASASLAQVHRAVLKPGAGGRLGPADGTDGVAFVSVISFSETERRDVAVKVQHRGLREASDSEIASLEVLMKVVIYLRPDFPFKWLVEELREKLPQELDFRTEAANSEECARRVKERFGDRVVVPAVYGELTSSRVLVMEFAPGCQVSDAAEIERKGLAPRAVARLMSEVFYDQIFSTGFCHCDPHPANVLVRPLAGHRGTPQLVLLDHGLYQRLDDTLRLLYAELWYSIVMADEDGMRHASDSMGIFSPSMEKMRGEGSSFALFVAVLTNRPWNRVKEDRLDSLDVVDTEGSEMKGKIQDGVAEYLACIIEIIDAVPRPVLMLLKLNDCLRSASTRLGARAVETYIVAARSSIIALKAGPTHGSWGERWKLEKALWRLWVFDWGHYISRWWGSLFSRKAAVAAIAN